MLCNRKEDLLEELALLNFFFCILWVSREVGAENNQGVMGEGDTYNHVGWN